ncbi:hypothetical protein Dimus_002846, partial [Dionaea muscipula]
MTEWASQQMEGRMRIGGRGIGQFGETGGGQEYPIMSATARERDDPESGLGGPWFQRKTES